jgi:hypothetical protein
MRACLIAIALFLIFLSLACEGWSIEHHTRSRMLTTAAASSLAASIDCSRGARLDAATLHYKAACLITSLRICATLPEPTKFRCYASNEKVCEKDATAYGRFLGSSK